MATISGDGGNNSLTGTAGNDSIVGLSGDDSITGMGGDDTLYGGPGNDTIFGGDGADYFFEARGANSLNGGDGDDYFENVSHNYSGNTNDPTDQPGPDTITGGNGQDVYSLYLQAGFALLPDTVTDFKTGPGGDQINIQNIEYNFLTGYSFGANPFLTGFLRFFQSGAHTLLQVDADGPVGGANWGTVLLLQNTTATNFTADNIFTLKNTINAWDFNPQGTGGVLSTGDGGANTLYGSANYDTLIGNGGNDALYGGSGDDSVSGGAGNDTLDGYYGNDMIVGGTGADFITGDDGNDTLVGGDLPSFLAGGSGNDSIAGNGRQNETAFYHSVSVNLATGLATGGDGNDTLSGIDKADGSGDADTIIGNAFSNYLNGGGGDDSIGGGAGDDILEGEQGNDTLDGGVGSDQANYIDAVSGVAVDLSVIGPQNAGGGMGTDLLIGIESLWGSRFDDTLRGDAGDNMLIGIGGADWLRGGLGNDSLFGGDNVDTAVFAGPRSAYSIKIDGWSAFVSGPDGQDALYDIERLVFDDGTVRLPRGTAATIDFAHGDPASYMGAIRDFDGHDLGGANGWKLIGEADVQNDGDPEYVLINRQIGRWATVGPAFDGKVYFENYSWGGDTRVVGIYIDPLVDAGIVAKGSDFDSQRRFQNDLSIGNIDKVLAAGDFDRDGLQEVYFGLTDHTAYLHAYMHADGNIRYANYQSQAQVIDYLAGHGFHASDWNGWL